MVTTVNTSSVPKLFSKAPPSSAMSKVYKNNMDSDSYPGTKGFELILSHPKTVIFFVTPAAYARQEFKNCQVILLCS